MGLSVIYMVPSQPDDSRVRPSGHCPLMWIVDTIRLAVTWPRVSTSRAALFVDIFAIRPRQQQSNSRTQIHIQFSAIPQRTASSFSTVIPSVIGTVPLRPLDPPNLSHPTASNATNSTNDTNDTNKASKQVVRDATLLGLMLVTMIKHNTTTMTTTSAVLAMVQRHPRAHSWRERDKHAHTQHIVQIAQR